MTPALRRWLFLAAAAGFAAFYLWGLTSLPGFGHYPGPYGAVILAFLALYWRRLPVLRRGFEPGTGLVQPLRRFQSGIVNDYVTWVVLGLACIGGALAFTIR